MIIYSFWTQRCIVLLCVYINAIVARRFWCFIFSETSRIKPNAAGTLSLSLTLRVCMLGKQMLLLKSACYRSFYAVMRCNQKMFSWLFTTTEHNVSNQRRNTIFDNVYGILVQQCKIQPHRYGFVSFVHSFATRHYIFALKNGSCSESV